MPSLTNDRHSLPVSELVADSLTSHIAHSTHQTEDHYASRHNPDYRTRNATKTLILHNLLSSFRNHITSCALAENQTALNDAYARLTSAAKGFEPLPLPRHGGRGKRWVELKVEPGEGLEVTRIWEADFWIVKHGEVEEGCEVGELGERGDGSKEALERARGWWKAVKNWRMRLEEAEEVAQEVKAKEDEMKGQGDGVGQPESQETTLVDDEEAASAVSLPATPLENTASLTGSGK